MPESLSLPVSAPLLYPRLPTPSRPLHTSGAQLPWYGASDCAAGVCVGYYPAVIGAAEG